MKLLLPSFISTAIDDDGFLFRGLHWLESDEDVLLLLWKMWVVVRRAVVAPVLRFVTVLCMIMSVMLVLEFVWMGAVSLGVKLLRRRPEKRYKWEVFKEQDEDVELGILVYPMVLVQIPMFNEKEVYKLSIGAACGLEWPPDRIIIQVVVILGKEERMFAKSTFAIIISDSLTFLVDKPKLAIRPRTGRKPAVVSTSTIVNVVERRELLFKTDLWITIKIYMEKTQLDTGIPLCCSLQLTYVDSHVDILKNSEVNLVKNRALAF